MKALILTCATGEGHNSAARALTEYFQSAGTECEMADTLSLISPAVSQSASDIYVFSTRTRLFRFAYRAGSMVSSNKTKSPIYLANKLYCGKLFKYIRENGFDTLICTHLFPAEAITALRREEGFNEKTIFVMTDYTCIPFMEETRLDYYIIPHEHLIEECANKGIPREKMLPYGIPVRETFYSRIPREVAREECKELFDPLLDENKHWLLIMSGSMGFGKLAILIQEIINSGRTDLEIFIVCGNNAELVKSLSKEFGENKNIRILGYTYRISTLMDACDVLFSKPGGLSSTEAAAKNIPIIHTAPIPGCETRNALFFHFHGMSYSSIDPKEQVRQAFRLCDESEYRSAMSASQKANINPDTCKNILELCYK